MVKATIFKTHLLLEEFFTILYDKSFTLKKFLIRRSALERILEKNSNIQYKTMLKLVKIYNEYYKVNLDIYDIFNYKIEINELYNWKKEIEFEFANKKNSIDNFISWVINKDNI